MIVLYCRIDFIENGFLDNNFVVPNVLKACEALQLIGFGKGVHGKCEFLGDARKVFDEMLDRNAVAWNSMIASYVQNVMSEETLKCS